MIWGSACLLCCVRRRLTFFRCGAAHSFRVFCIMEVLIFWLILECHPGVASVVEFWVCFGLPFEGVVIFWSVLEMSSRGGECVEFWIMFWSSLEILILL